MEPFSIDHIYQYRTVGTDVSDCLLSVATDVHQTGHIFAKSTGGIEVSGRLLIYFVHLAIMGNWWNKKKICRIVMICSLAENVLKSLIRKQDSERLCASPWLLVYIYIYLFTIKKWKKAQTKHNSCCCMLAS